MKKKTMILTLLFLISIICWTNDFKQNQEIGKNLKTVHLKDNLNQDTRDLVSEIISEIDPIEIEQTVQSLVDFDTRYYAADNKYEVANWLHGKFLDCGLSPENVEIDSFYFNNEWHRNVYGIISGSIHPDKYIIVSGHYDTISETPMTYAPGADDDASAIAAIFESAKVMIDNNFQPDVSIMFTLFGSKEPGRYGSDYLANKFIQENTELLYALNLELLGYTTVDSDEWQISYNRYSGSEFLLGFIADIMDEYTTLNMGTIANNFNYYDCWNFYQNGFNVAMLSAEEFNMGAHSTGDTIENLNFSYLAELNRLACASVIQLSRLPQNVEDVSIFDDGSGSGLFVTWSPSGDTDFDYFEIAWGTESGVYENVLTTTGTEILITGLTEAQTYYIGLATVDSDGNRSFYIENEAAPYYFPQIPQNLWATPTWEGIQLDWIPNSEMDIEGYNVFRSYSSDGNYDIINSELLVNNEFFDSNTENGTFYFYKLQAVDLSGNTSEFTNPVRSRIISMDQGILLIDDTINGSGAFLQPTDEDCDSFYESVLTGFSHDVLDTSELERVFMDDICAYSTVIWYIDDNMNQSNASAAMEDVAYYLDEGGKLFLSGIRPVTKLCGIQGLPVEFSEGDFAWDYLNLVSLEFSNSARFNHAFDTGGEDIFVDEEKVPAAMNHHLIGVEALILNEYGNSSYSYGTDYNAGTPFAVLDGLPVNSSYYGDGYKLYVLSFPLYYMQENYVSELMNYILIEKFTETASSDEKIIPHNSGIKLIQNYPNPFNPTTTISFNLVTKDAMNTKLEICNLKGQKVKQLLNENLTAGNYSVVWHGIDEKGKPVSSGVYFYSLTANGKTIDSKKMLLLK